MATTREVAGMVIYAVGGGFGLWIAVRGGMAGVRIDEKGITERGLGRSRAVGWCSIRAVAPADQGAGPLETVFTELVLTDGTTRPLQVVASYFPRAAEADLHVITTAHAAHRATCQTCTT
ncbi:PH domain-containing protein [Streptomyces sp. NPDC046374]|uniref:PH domain-containing protein n=1 Tax=Streptomyces sp. NPDC046374 TaxID=3154917 RepID=UPI0033D13073